MIKDPDSRVIKDPDSRVIQSNWRSQHGENQSSSSSTKTSMLSLHREGGFKASKKYDSFPAIMEDLCDAQDDYFCDKNADNLKILDGITSHAVW